MWHNIPQKCEILIASISKLFMCNHCTFLTCVVGNKLYRSTHELTLMVELSYLVSWPLRKLLPIWGRHTYVVLRQMPFLS